METDVGAESRATTLSLPAVPLSGRNARGLQPVGF